jgi:tetratricopeptide (TPR) repeat protein
MRTKALVIKRKKSTGVIMTSVLMLVSILVIIAFAFEAHGASAPKKQTKQSKSAAEKRAEANTYFDQGKRFQDQKNFKEAARKYEKAIKADPNYAEAHSNLGYSYRKQGKFDKAVRSYKKAISLDPKLAEAHEYLGEAYAEMGKFDLAAKELQILRDLGSDEADELAEFINKKKAGM